MVAFEEDGDAWYLAQQGLLAQATAAQSLAVLPRLASLNSLGWQTDEAPGFFRVDEDIWLKPLIWPYVPPMPLLPAYAETEEEFGGLMRFQPEEDYSILPMLSVTNLWPLPPARPFVEMDPYFSGPVARQVVMPATKGSLSVTGLKAGAFKLVGMPPFKWVEKIWIDVFGWSDPNKR